MPTTIAAPKKKSSPAVQEDFLPLEGTDHIEFYVGNAKQAAYFYRHAFGFSQLASVRAYIAGQEEHHRKVSFQDEFRLLLKRYEIEFDERYVWD